MFVTSQGSAYVRFRRALETGNELLVLATARELPRVPLDDALRICLLIRGGDPDRYERAAVRWLGRFALEARGVTIHAFAWLRTRSTRCPTSQARRWSGYSACASHTALLDAGVARS